LLDFGYCAVATFRHLVLLSFENFLYVIALCLRGVQAHISYYLDLSCCDSARAHYLLAFHWFFICRNSFLPGGLSSH